MTPDPFIIYAALISIISAALTVYDKTAARSGKRRIPESVFILLAVMGGGTAEYLTMQIIRHKTKHLKFMFLLPIIILIHILLLIFAYSSENITF